MTVWVNGRLAADDEPVLPLNDHGLTVGDGVFETAKVVEGVPFALGRHLRRLAASASGLGLEVDLDVVRAGVAAVLAANPAYPLARLRVTVTAGPSPLGSDRGSGPPTVAVAVVELARWAPSAAVVTVPWARNERSATAGLKTTSYADNVVALHYAHEREADEALFPNTAGMLCEATGSNVFVVRDGRVRTPPLSAGCLGGITRELLLEWAPEIAEEDLAMGELELAEEVFLSSSTRDVMPVHRVDGRALAAPGPVTARLAGLFRERAGASPEP